MNFHLKRHRKLSEVLHVPEGLPELMADIAREVLRYQPSNIEVFIADYLEAMVLTRELYYVSERTVDDILSQSVHIKEMMAKTGIPYSKSEAAIRLVMDTVKKHSRSSEHIKELDIVNRFIKELNFTIDQAKKASEIIENLWCHYYNQNKNYVLKYQTKIDGNQAVQHTLELHRRSEVKIPSEINLKEVLKPKPKDFKEFNEKNAKMNWKTPNFQNREEAAKFIQAWYRGAIIRRDARKLLNAAAKIQAGFKGFKTRQEMHDKIEESRALKKQREEAAIKIQSWFRSCQIRKNFKIEKNAAVTIQAHFRGYLTRKMKKENE